MEVIKTGGEKEKFSESKLCLSIRKAGAPRDLADTICKTVGPKINPNDSTSAIFRRALKYLVREDMGIAARYSLRRGIEALGPAGFIFEHYFQTVLDAYGFKTRRNVIMKGYCVTHEIDVIAASGSNFSWKQNITTCKVSKLMSMSSCMQMHDCKIL